jgi:carboxylesterase type B
LTFPDTPIVFVSVNYRPDLFGFPYVLRFTLWSVEAVSLIERRRGKAFADAGAANIGIRDITQGLWWVQENIWAFGGDPSKVKLLFSLLSHDRPLCSAC